jgi:histone H3/H4
MSAEAESSSNSSSFAIPPTVFQRVARSFQPDVRVSAKAFEVLQKQAEDHVVAVFKAAHVATEKDKRKTLLPRDLPTVSCAADAKKEVLDQFTKPALKRLATAAGCTDVSQQVYDPVRVIVYDYLGCRVAAAVKHMQAAKRKSLSDEDFSAAAAASCPVSGCAAAGGSGGSRLSLDLGAVSSEEELKARLAQLEKDARAALKL